MPFNNVYFRNTELLRHRQGFFYPAPIIKDFSHDPVFTDLTVHGLHKAKIDLLPSLSNVREGWVAFLLRYYWDLAFTLTWRNVCRRCGKSEIYTPGIGFCRCNRKDWRRDPHPSKILKQVNLWTRKISDFFLGGHWEKRHVTAPRWAISFEKHKDGSTHVHGVLSLDEANRWIWPEITYCEKLWSKMSGRSKIEVPDSQEAVCRYITKELLKGYDGEMWGHSRGRIETSEAVTFPGSKAYIEALRVKEQRIAQHKNKSSLSPSL